MLQIRDEDLKRIKKLPRLRLGDTRSLEAGAKVVAIGNPGVVDSESGKLEDLRLVTLTHTTSEGIVSAAR